MEILHKIPDMTLINLPSPFLEDALIIPPIGIVQLYSFIKSQHYDVELVDLNLLTVKEDLISAIMDRLRVIKSPIVGISASTAQARFLLLCLAVFRDSVISSTPWIVVGGPHATVLPTIVLNLGFDTVVEGEAELVIDDIFGCFSGIISGIPIENLDELPYPDRTISSNYTGPAPVMAMRGCPYACSFCSKTMEKRVRFRSPAHVIDELKMIKNSNVIFYDENFTTNYDWVANVCDAISKAGIRKKFRCSTRADRITAEVAQMMKTAGFNEICVGVESGSQKILDALNKKTTVEQNSLARKICKDAGIKFKAYIMLGCPNEDEQTLWETYFWIRDNHPDKIGLYMYTPLPGSDVWNHTEKYDINFDKLEYDRAFYGGKRDELISPISTSALSKQEITKMYWKMLNDFEDLL